MQLFREGGTDIGDNRKCMARMRSNQTNLN
jgi:hypothetical protein